MRRLPIGVTDRHLHIGTAGLQCCRTLVAKKKPLVAKPWPKQTLSRGLRMPPKCAACTASLEGAQTARQSVSQSPWGRHDSAATSRRS